MAHEAFALSPISARGAQSGEADYEAIREAFMETARGRWFLGEYAKRNRQSDTRMVLNAVARIERMLEAAQQPPPGTRLPEILDILSDAVGQAAAAAAAAVDGLAIEQRLAPVRKGARILKKISWRWREIGSDSRICDQIDAEVDAIQDSCRQLAAIDIAAALTGAFELIRTRLRALAEDDGHAVPPAADAATKPRSAAATVHMATADDTRADTLGRTRMAAPDAAASRPETRVTAVLDAATKPSPPLETADVQDEAILGLLAVAIEDHCWDNAAGGDRAEPDRSKPVVVAEQVEPASIPTGRRIDRPWMRPQPPAARLAQLHPSLGSTPFTSELPEQHGPKDADTSPAIRRMSLTEKIEFFS